MPYTEKIMQLWEKIRPQRPEEEKDEELHALLLEAQREIAVSRQGLKFADSKSLTDMYIYAIKASELKYAHLLQLAKEADAASSCPHAVSF